MKFYEYLEQVNKEEDNVFEARVGDVSMPAVYAGKVGMNLDNPYLREKYGALLDTEVEILEPFVDDSDELDICYIYGPVMELAVNFFWAAAGNTSKEEYDKLFVTEEDLGTQKNPYARKYGGEEFNCIDITEEFVSRYGEFFSGHLQRVELTFSTHSFDRSKALLDKRAKEVVDVFINKDISFDGEHLIMTLKNGKVLVIYTSEFGSIYTLK